MKPVNCTVKDDPANGSYGDCVRACVASILEMESDAVPHFFHDGNGENGFDRMRVWLADRGRVPAYLPFGPEMSVDAVCWSLGVYGDISAMLFCSSAGGDHCIVINKDGVQHNPAWYASPIDGPHSQGVWIVILLARI